MDARRMDFRHISDPEKMRQVLLDDMVGKLAHAAGTTYSEAVRNCFTKGLVEDLEDWKSQMMVREKVLDQIAACIR